MKMWLESRIFRWVGWKSASRRPTVRVLLKRGERPVVSVSIIRWFIGISDAVFWGFGVAFCLKVGFVYICCCGKS